MGGLTEPGPKPGDVGGLAYPGPKPGDMGGLVVGPRPGLIGVPIEGLLPIPGDIGALVPIGLGTPEDAV